MIGQTIENFGQFDVAFNNSGIMLPNIDTTDVNMTDYDQLMDVNLRGVLGLTKSVALEYATRNIRINAVCPGTIDTPMVHKMYEKGDLIEDDIARLHPMGRLGKASEVANAILLVVFTFIKLCNW